MGNEGSKGGSSSVQMDIDSLSKESGFSREDIEKWLKDFKECAPSDKGLDKKNFVKACERIGLLNNISVLATQAVDKGDGTQVTMHMNQDEVKKDVIEVLWRVFDNDRNGRVDFRELLLGAAIVMKGTIDQKARALFNLHDANGDGTLTKDELQKSIKRTMKAGRKIIRASMKQLEHDLGKAHAYRTEKVSDEMAKDYFVKIIVEKIFSEADVDRNGTVSLEEFVAFAKRNPDTLKSLFQIAGDPIPPPPQTE